MGRAHTATKLVDGKVLLVGGVNGSTTLANAAIYNPASGAGSFAATTGPIPPQGLKAHTATLLATSNQQLNGKVLLVGGNNGTSSIAAVYLFDPAQSAFSTLASIPTPREGHTATLMPDGKVLVTGGKNGSTTLATAVVFDPGFGPGAWSSTGNMTVARWGHTATLLPATILANGQVLVAGGSNGSGTLASAELYSAGLGTWGTTPAMPGPAQGHTATLLTGNMVLVAGGLSGSTVLSAAQLYDGSFGLGCSGNSQCASGFCVGGVCCESACNGGCGACNLPGFVGQCKPLGTTMTCRGSAGVCDVAETCNGTAVTCPTDALAGPATTCRAAAGDCDAAETCTGASAACPADALKPNNTACTDDGNVCTQDKCNGASATCQHPAGNGGTVCRAAAGDCDVAEACTGTATSCPADIFASATTVCRGSAGTCDVVESCTGTSAACPANALVPTGTTCRAANGVCDVAEACTGASPSCPGDGYVPTGTTCRAATGACDVAEACTGTGAACPGDGYVSAGTTCRAATGACDVAEACTGTGAACPGDGYVAAGTTCRAANGQCDVAESCTGTGAACPLDAYASNGALCSDGDSCTSGDACQNGGCVPGPGSCATVTVTHSPGTANASPRLAATLAPSLGVAVPGDPVTFTAVVSNVGTLLDFYFAWISVQNSGATPFVLGAYQHTLEYYSLSSGTWIPFARNAVAADGTPLTDPDVQTIRYEVISAEGGNGVTYTGNPIVGTSIQPGGTAIFVCRLSPVIAAATVNVVFDPVESGGLRLALHFDAPSGPGYTSYADLGAAFEGYAGAVTDVGAQLGYTDPLTSPIGLSSTEVGPLAPGATRTFSGTVPSPLTRTRDQFASDSAYTFELLAGGLFPYNVRVTPTGLGLGGIGAGATPVDAQIARQIPYMAASKAGPAQGNAGLRLPFPVRLDAFGNATSFPLAITDSLDGVLMDSSATLPGALAPGQSGTATLFAASPLDRPPGPATDEAAVTWADRNGNVYGPIHSTFTTNLLAGHPEGYVLLTGETGLPDLPGDTAELTATVQNGLGQPIAGVTVHFTVTGPNATSGNVVSDAAGQAVFTYSGAGYGTDTVIASATPISATVQSAPIHRIWAQPNGTPCTGRKDPLDVLLVI